MHVCDFAFLWKMIPHSALVEWHGDIIVGGDLESGLTLGIERQNRF